MSDKPDWLTSLQTVYGIQDKYDFIKPEKKHEIDKFRALLYDWDEGVDVEQKINEFLKDGLCMDDLDLWLSYYG